MSVSEPEGHERVREAVLAGEVGPAIDGHLATCPECALLASVRRKLVQAAAAQDVPAPSGLVEGVMQRLRRETLLVAAGGTAYSVKADDWGQAGRWSDDRELLGLRSTLERWESAAYGDPLSAHRDGTLSRYLIGLRALAQGLGDRAEGAALAALALGPRTGKLPEAADLAPILKVADGTNADVVDLGIAWGCGWGRVVQPDRDWQDRWPAAVLSLSALVGGSINRTIRWLGGNVDGFQGALQARDPGERAALFAGHAVELAMELALGACSCGHDGRLTNSCRSPQHRLDSWRPDECRLPAFLATAVRGSARFPPRAGAFAVSMLANLLQDDHLIRIDVAEFQVCHVCNPDVIRLAARRGGVDIASIDRGLHNVQRCPSCDTRVDPRRTYYALRKRWLLVPAEWGGRYQLAHRHRCTTCGNLFERTRERCPLCRQPVSPRHRLIHVWAYLPPSSSADRAASERPA
jgi:hypothetical protein